MNTRGELTPKERNSKWNHIRRQLKQEFEAMGVTRCEVCQGTFALSFAHTRKRRNQHSIADLREVALLCQTHHHEYEMLGEERMHQAITAIIALRSTT